VPSSLKKLFYQFHLLVTGLKLESYSYINTSEEPHTKHFT